MRKLLIIICVFAFASCKQTPDEKMKSEIEKYVNENFHDPKSFEFIKLSIIDTEFVKETIRYAKFKIQSDNELLKSTKEIIPGKDELIKMYTQLGNANEVEKNLEDKEKYEKEILEFEDEIQANNALLKKLNTIDSNRIYEIHGQVEYRAKNKVGALNLSKANIHFNDSLRLVLFEIVN